MIVMDEPSDDKKMQFASALYESIEAEVRLKTLVEVEKMIEERIERNKNNYGYPMAEVYYILEAIQELKEGGRG